MAQATSKGPPKTHMTAAAAAADGDEAGVDEENENATKVIMIVAA